MPERIVRVLSIDGGGIRGIIPAVVLEHIEAQTGQRIARLFDLIVGTSTGGVMALLLTIPGRDGEPRYSATEVREFYTQHGRELFSVPEGYGAGRLSGTYPRYPASQVAATLGRFFGTATLTQTVTGLLVSAYDLETLQPKYFLAPRQGDDENFYMRDVAQATSAFPGMFPPVEIRSVGGETTLRLIDGGLTSANPAGLASICVRQGFAIPIGSQPLLLSLGTGTGRISLPWDEVKDWGFAQWMAGGALVDLLFRGASQSADIEARSDDVDYVRLQIELPAERASTDDVSDANIQGLLDIARDEIQTPRSRFSRFDRFERFVNWPEALAYAIGLLTHPHRSGAPSPGHGDWSQRRA